MNNRAKRSWLKSAASRWACLLLVLAFGKVFGLLLSVCLWLSGSALSVMLGDSA